MNAQVVCVSHKHPTEPYYRFDVFLESLRRFADKPTVLGMGEKWSGLMTKAFLYRQWLRDGKNTSDRLILCDAWDIVFAKHPHGIGDDCIKKFGKDAVVFNGEKSCWPHVELSSEFEFKGAGPWRYLNCGFICGSADLILKMLEAMNLESIGVDRKENGKTIEPNDQGEFQKMYPRQPVKMVVDTNCSISQTLSSCTIDEFDLTGTHIKNKVTGEEPGVFHFNGGSKNDIMPLMHKHWNL